MMKTSRVLALVLTATSSITAAEGAPDYFRDIAPLVRQYCAGCHNDLDLEGDLSLERFADLKDGGWGGGEMLRPGDPEGSELIKLITGVAKEPMPPADEPQLKPAEVETIRQWIAAGAKWPQASHSSRRAASVASTGGS